VGTLSHGNYFGEIALLREDTRQATVTSMTPGAECLVLDRGYVTFTKLKLVTFHVHGRRAHTFVMAINVTACQYFLLTIQLHPVNSPSGLRTCI
jgi:CRP-like cAMP-binding protein